MDLITDQVLAWRMSYGNRAKANVIWSKFRSINGFILRNWGACVDTVFCTCQNDQSGLIGRGKLLYTLTADENQFVKMVADEWWWSMERLI